MHVFSSLHFLFPLIKSYKNASYILFLFLLTKYFQSCFHFIQTCFLYVSFTLPWVMLANAPIQCSQINHFLVEGCTWKSWILSSHCAMTPLNLLIIDWINTIIKFLLFGSCTYVNTVLFHIHLLHPNIHHIETLIKPYLFPSRVQPQLCKSHEWWEKGLQRGLNITFHAYVQMKDRFLDIKFGWTNSFLAF